MGKVSEWRDAAVKRQEAGSVLTKYAQGKYDEQDQQSRFYKISMSTDTVGFAEAGHARYCVDLQNCTCSCNYPFQQVLHHSLHHSHTPASPTHLTPLTSHQPCPAPTPPPLSAIATRAPVQHQVACRHLIAVAKKKGLTSRNNLPAWYKRCIHPGFFMDAYVNVLRHSGVMLVDMDSLVVNPNHIANDPDRTPGRPRSKRIKSAGEIGGNAAKAPKYKCSRCGVIGHNVPTCTRLLR